MTKLSNPRHEAFAQGLYRGMPASTAYEEAGYKPNRGNAVTLKAKKNIQDRLSELQEGGRKMSDVTVQSLTAMYLETYEAAKQDRSHAATSSTVERIAKLHGLQVEKTENLNMVADITDTPQMTDEEWMQTYKPN